MKNTKNNFTFKNPYGDDVIIGFYNTIDFLNKSKHKDAQTLINAIVLMNTDDEFDVIRKIIDLYNTICEIFFYEMKEEGDSNGITFNIDHFANSIKKIMKINDVDNDILIESLMKILHVSTIDQYQVIDENIIVQTDKLKECYGKHKN